MNLLKKIILILLVFYVKSFSQIKPGAREIALSHSDIASVSDIYALYNNASGLSRISNREVSLFYSPSPFGISKLANGALLYHEPTSFGNFTFAINNYGFELYREMMASVSFSKIIFQKLFVGITSNYKNISIKNYGSDYALTLNVGLQYKISTDINVGFALNNISRSTIGDEENQLPTSLALGLGFMISNSISLNTALEKEIDMDASLRIGIEYFIIKYLALRIGAMTEPSSFSAGFGINYSIFEIDYAVFNHQDLGFTHQFNLTLKFGNNIKRAPK